jgi:hypothetical protein
MMDVRCESFRSDEHGGLRGFCDLVIQPLGVRLFSCKLFVSGGREWIELPSRQYESNGKSKWARTIDFTTRSALESFQSAALEAIRQFREQSKKQAAPVRSGAGA